MQIRLCGLSPVLHTLALIQKPKEVRKCGGLEVGDVGGGT
jgi:hypothetical protein